MLLIFRINFPKSYRCSKILVCYYILWQVVILLNVGRRTTQLSNNSILKYCFLVYCSLPINCHIYL